MATGLSSLISALKKEVVFSSKMFVLDYVVSQHETASLCPQNLPISISVHAVDIRCMSITEGVRLVDCVSEVKVLNLRRDSDSPRVSRGCSETQQISAAIRPYVRT
jgi:hypothetical protein